MRKTTLILLFAIIYSCSVEQDVVNKIFITKFNSLSQINIDSIEVYRYDRDNNLDVQINYQANTYNTLYDTIKWEFPGGTPSEITDLSEASIMYNKYGTYTAKMVLLKYDTLNYGNISVQVDTITLNDNLAIKYKEKNWSTYQANANWQNVGSYQTYIDVNEVYDNNNPIALVSDFSGFENKKVRINFKFKVALNTPISDSYTVNRKNIQFKVDGFTKYSLTGVENDKYYSAYISITDKNEFELKFEVYPPLLSSDWRISNNGNAIPMYSLSDHNQNNFLLGYSDLSTSSSATIELNDLSFGSSDMTYLSLSDTTKILLPQGKSKILVKMKDELPSSFEIFEEGSIQTGTSLSNDEYFYKLFIKDLIIEVLD
ncbi:MAG: hypothetical protein CBC08_03275 [Flavobacteriaceae bacterium TMED48]|nr:MAG: hypothetical protein CBC08_03275 [Flavobacteriaceae bacterium TMED48]